MSAPKLTPWFPAAANPVRKGWYEVRCAARPARFYAGNFADGMRYWDGVVWRIAKGARVSNVGRLEWLNDEWRGLAADPKAKP